MLVRHITTPLLKLCRNTPGYFHSAEILYFGQHMRLGSRVMMSHTVATSLLATVINASVASKRRSGRGSN
jgi:hypothetical protein